MKISILVSSPSHPINIFLGKWVKQNSNDHKIGIFHSKNDLDDGDILFLISCEEILPKNIIDRYKKTLIIHASDLPLGKGWSPHIWEIINGASEVKVSLIEADDEIDSGDIWTKINVSVPKTCLYDEINELIFNAEIELMSFAIENFHIVKPTKQDKKKSTYWSKRSSKDSEIDLKKSLDQQFDLIRVCDPNRFPAFFYKNGKKYFISVSRFPESK
jgi:methionyl-tRNA formyltransferase